MVLMQCIWEGKNSLFVLVPAILILKIFAMAAAVLLVGIGLEKAIRWGEREGIVRRGYSEDARKVHHRNP